MSLYHLQIYQVTTISGLPSCQEVDQKPFLWPDCCWYVVSSLEGTLHALTLQRWLKTANSKYLYIKLLATCQLPKLAHKSALVTRKISRIHLNLNRCQYTALLHV